jgi:type II secretory pathway pseudopilin PulG
MQLKAPHSHEFLPDGTPAGSKHNEAGYSLVEGLVCAIIVAVLMGAIINGYVFGAKQAQWSCYSLAAQSLALHAIEQARSAKWDGNQNVEITNLTLLNKSYTGYLNASGVATNYLVTGYTTNILDIPWKGNNYVLATNFITIQSFYPYSGVQMQIVRVDTVWPFAGWGNFTLNYYTNSICTYIAPDNRDPNDLGVGD